MNTTKEKLAETPEGKRQRNMWLIKSESAHTPGPWRLGSEFGNPPRILDQSSRPICQLCACQSREQEQANAKLIAAAPETAAERDELLAACKALLDLMVNSGAWKESELETLDIAVEARAAIKHAQERQ